MRCYNNHKRGDSVNFFDKESNIIEYFQTTCHGIIFNSIKSIFIVNKVLKSCHWKNWVDNSKKSDPPPDFYSDKYKLMMEVMRVDDHTKKLKSGKLYNATNVAESKIYSELKSKGIEDGVNGNKVIVISHSNLPTEEDHNYKFYISSFKRVLEKHNSQIPLYKKNHPKHKCVFLIIDESCAYAQANNTEELPSEIITGAPYRAEIHKHFFDEEFINVLKEIKADYVIWFSPYKHYIVSGPVPLNLPNTAVYDMKKIRKVKSIHYPPDLIFPTER